MIALAQRPRTIEPPADMPDYCGQCWRPIVRRPLSTLGPGGGGLIVWRHLADDSPRCPQGAHDAWRAVIAFFTGHLLP